MQSRKIFQTKYVLFVLSLGFVSAASAVQFGLVERLKEAQKLPPGKHEAVVIEAGKAIGKLPRQMDGTWDRKQLNLVIQLLRAEPDHVLRQQMIEFDTVYLKDNRAQIASALKTVPAQESKDILWDIDAMINMHEHGQDPRADRAK